MMKKIRTRRITIRKREVVISGKTERRIDFEEGEARICPLCNSLIHAQTGLPAIYDEKKLLTTAGHENLLTEEN